MDFRKKKTVAGPRPGIFKFPKQMGEIAVKLSVFTETDDASHH